ncbi:MAG: phasin family protein [Proteobacteria bacterium]|nr:phasin family protein [Pseudomonadota bacterium]
MAQEKNTKAKASRADWKEQQHKYAQTAKDMFEKFSDFAKTSKPNHEKILQNHKKNLEAISDANKIAADVVKSLAKIQSDFVKQTFEDINAILRNVMTQKPGQPINLSQYSDVMKNSMQRTAEHAKNVGSVLANSGKEIHARVKSRAEEAGEDIKAHVSKYGKH